MPREVGGHRTHHHLTRMTAAHAAALREAIDATERAIGARGAPPDFDALEANLERLDADLAAWQGPAGDTMRGRPPGG